MEVSAIQAIAGLIISLAVLLYFIIKVKLHPFVSLILGALVFGFIAGEGPSTLSNIANGFGDLAAYIGPVIILGTLIGTVLERSGTLTAMARWLIEKTGVKRAPIALLILGYLVSISVFCDAAFAILAPLVIALSAESGIGLVAMTSALAFALHATHMLVPPTPGPLAAAGIMGADLGIVIALGLVLGVPHALVGYWWGRRVDRKYKIKPSEELLKRSVETSVGKEGKVFLGFLAILGPVFLIMLRSFVEYFFGDKGGIGLAFMQTIGHPIFALAIGLLISLFTLDKITPDIYSFSGAFGEGVKMGGMMVAIVGAGGAYAAVLSASPLVDLIKGAFLELGIAGKLAALLVPAAIGFLIRTSVGSGTTGLITAAAIIAPILEPIGFTTPLAKALAVMAAGAGATMIWHVNDDYFWVISSTTQIDPEILLKITSIGSVIQSVVTLAIVLLLATFII